MLDDDVAYRNEFEQLWWRARRSSRWFIKDIPDPHDDDEVRAAVLAVITHLLCKAFNHRIKLGLRRDFEPCISPADWDRIENTPDSNKPYESPPQWALSVKALSDPLVLPSFVWGGITYPQPDDQYLCPLFRRYNIIRLSPDVMFI